MEDIDIIRRVYYSLSEPGAYTGPSKIRLALKSKGINIRLSKIKKWFESEDNYTLQREVKRRFHRTRVIVSGQFEQYDIDLADVSSISKENNGIRYLLMCIDVFSRYLSIVPLKDKTAKSVLVALEKVLEHGRRVKKVRTDGGSEFCNRWVKAYLKKLNIYHHVTLNETKAGYAERVIKTIKNMMYRYFTKNRTYKYVNILEDLVKTYNSTPHTSLHNIAPKDVNASNEADLWSFMYLKPKKIVVGVNKKRIKTYSANFKYDKDDMIRMSHLRNVFNRAYHEQWTTEIFKIRSRFLMQGIPMYKLVDFNDEIVRGNFYESELQSVTKHLDTLWYIEKKIRKRKRKGKLEWLVKFEGWPDKYNAWVSQDDITEPDIDRA
ncbi:MAG: DDE-type integrase/transposase/recombinase [Sedimenticola sp.]